MKGPHAYPKACRIRRRRDYLSIQGHGRRRRTEHFVVVERPGTTPCSRLGITVSSKVGNAVVRNRLKRLVREVYRTRDWQAGPVCDRVVIARPGADGMRFADVQRELHDVFDAKPPTSRRS